MTALPQATPSAPPPLSPLPPLPQLQSTTTSIEALVLQERALRQLVDVLQARVTELRRQISSTTQDRRPALREQLSQTNLQYADARAQLKAVREEIRDRVGRDLLTETRPPSQPFIPGEGVAAMGIFFILAVLMPISIGLTRRLWKRGSPAPRPAAEDTVSPRLERLEHAVDAIAIEIERVSEGQRFMTKVMSERPVTAPPAKPQDSAEPSALSEMKPYLALGAGPAEPIPVAQRQAVRQSITPH